MRQKPKISVGIIGKNFGYNVIYKALLKSKLFKVTSFCVRKKNNIPKISNGVKIFSNWKKIIEYKNNQAIVISSPPSSHKKMISLAVKNNKHIFCEKPCTKSSKEIKSILDLIEKKNFFLSHMVNYSIAYLPSFLFFKKKILNKEKSFKEGSLEWIIYSKSSKKNWKQDPKKGGGILYNFYCHTIYYLELLFGDIKSTKVDIKDKIHSNDNYIIGDVIFKSNLKIKIKILIGNLNKHKKSIHKIKIKTNKNVNYILSSSTKSVVDQFRIYKIKDYKNFKIKKLLFTTKPSKNDFRIKPTLTNLNRFGLSITKKKFDRSSFFRANHVHYVLRKSLISSKKKKRIIINQ